MLDVISNADAAAFGAHGAVHGNQMIEEAGIRVDSQMRRGRASAINPSGCYELEQRATFHDGWDIDDELPILKTTVQVERARTIITRNQSPDLPFDRSINPYRGCEHGCVYCFARPTHAYMGMSPGLDFETRLYAKPDAAELLERELSKADYVPRTIAIGTNTDPYQPVEKSWQLMRGILEVLDRYNHPVAIVTKSALITRDIDILSRMAARGLAKVAISLTTMDKVLARAIEPRAASPTRRLETMRTLNEAGIPCNVMTAPIIPGLNDHEVERLLDSAAAAGANEAGYVMLRLPLEVAPVFKEWLLRHYPDKFRHVMTLIRSMRDGKDYDAEWNKRMRGSGPYAWQIGRRFEIKAKQLGLNLARRELRTDLFIAPHATPKQMCLF
jgi:DNA repair photolyase